MDGAAIFFKGGIKYGIDFRGGTNVDVRFAQPPNIDELRKGLQAQGLGNSEIQSISDIANPNSNEVMIFVEQTGQMDQALDEGKSKVLTALNATYAHRRSSKPDFNSVTPTALANFLAQRDPLGLSVSCRRRTRSLPKSLLDYRDKNNGGVITNFDDLSKAARRYTRP